VTENFLSVGRTEQLPRVAVVIVTYNSADVLGGCLRSLTRMTGVDLKTVVIADNA